MATNLVVRIHQAIIEGLAPLDPSRGAAARSGHPPCCSGHLAPCGRRIGGGTTFLCCGGGETKGGSGWRDRSSSPSLPSMGSQSGTPPLNVSRKIAVLGYRACAAVPAIVEYCVANKKPFCILPCCSYPVNGERCNNVAEMTDKLQAAHPAIKQDVVDGSGTVLWCTFGRPWY